jgi:hypothetical protein
MTTTKHKCKKIIFTIDCDYEELVDAIGLDYSRHGTDLKIKVFLDPDEFKRFYSKDEVTFCSRCLNYELGETCSEVHIYNPSKEDYKNYYLD